MEFTHDQRYENYLTLQRSLQELRSGRKVTDDWENTHYNFFVRTRGFFTDFNRVLYNDETPELRKKCSELERLAAYTEKYIEQTGKIDYAVYTLFLERLLYLAEYFMPDDELTDLMEKLGM